MRSYVRARPGKIVKIKGFLNPTLGGKNVTLTITGPDNSTAMRKTITEVTGYFEIEYWAYFYGSNKVIASWPGDETHEGTTSYAVTFSVTKIPSALSCNTDKPEYDTREFVRVFGVISPSYSGVNVTLSFTGPILGNHSYKVLTKPDGTYSRSFYNIFFKGSNRVQASWPGDDVTSGATSPPAYFNIIKKPTKLSLSIEPEKTEPGGKADIQGILSHNPPLPGKNVTLTITNPDATKNNMTFTTDSSGIFNHEFQPEEHGKYEFQASWSGNATYKAATSQILELTVERTQPWIPGFPIESIILSIIFASVIIWVINKRT